MSKVGGMHILLVGAHKEQAEYAKTIWTNQKYMVFSPQDVCFDFSQSRFVFYN